MKAIKVDLSANVLRSREALEKDVLRLKQELRQYKSMLAYLSQKYSDAGLTLPPGVQKVINVDLAGDVDLDDPQLLELTMGDAPPAAGGVRALLPMPQPSEAPVAAPPQPPLLRRELSGGSEKRLEIRDAHLSQPIKPAVST
eukprot:4403832-Prymnesium_polylepis.1